jgi:hypothetical protein
MLLVFHKSLETVRVLQYTFKTVRYMSSAGECKVSLAFTISETLQAGYSPEFKPLTVQWRLLMN